MSKHLKGDSKVKELEIAVSPDEVKDENAIREKLLDKLRKLNWSEHFHFRLKRKSLDARSKRPLFRMRYQVSTSEFPEGARHLSRMQIVHDRPEVLIIGAGPAGYFAALQLIEEGLRPIVLDRGKDVRARRRDLKKVQQFGEVDPDSNYCFGEGGAGTYSDGKLYTRSHKRGRIQKILELLVEHGAKKEILTDAHPHIGSNKLPGIISTIRKTIEDHGGQVHFNTRVIDFITRDQKVHGVISASGEHYTAASTILATGHSARDIFDLLEEKGIELELKPFALGVRVEHPQEFVDRAQLHHYPRHENIGAADYKLRSQVKDRGVYSFCMCPGGLIVPAATQPGELVVNGMSLSRRDSPYANSGIVVEITEEDLAPYTKNRPAFAGIEFQRAVEQKLFEYGDGSQKAPAQRIIDFLKGEKSTELPDTSYIPGIYSAPLHELLPEFVVERLRKAFVHFDKKMKGYLHKDAVMVGTESRTSSPIRIPRSEDFVHIRWEGLYPCGEGAGYAGGIISAALDGANCAKAVAQKYRENNH
ncbi:MAG TPA: FAD-binding protein [Saprospiraceae bacterium]|nr:FAD-binding protein [Saprospiraceae bacterium]